MLAAGGYWYVRNLVAVGNPIPYIGSIGPISLPAPVARLPAPPRLRGRPLLERHERLAALVLPGAPRVVRDPVAGDPRRDARWSGRSRSGAAASRSCDARRLRAGHRGRLPVHPADRGRRSGAADRLHLEPSLSGPGGGRRPRDPALPAGPAGDAGAPRRSSSARSPSCSAFTVGSLVQWKQGHVKGAIAAAPGVLALGGAGLDRCAGAAAGAATGRGVRAAIAAAAIAVVVVAGYAEQRHYLARAYEDTGRRAGPRRGTRAGRATSADARIARRRDPRRLHPVPVLRGRPLQPRPVARGCAAPHDSYARIPDCRRWRRGGQRRRLHARGHHLRSLPPGNASQLAGGPLDRVGPERPAGPSRGPGTRLPAPGPARPRRMRAARSRSASAQLHSVPNLNGTQRGSP